MPKRINFQLPEEGLREIVEAIKRDKRPEVRQRAMGLRLLHEGQAPKEVAELLSVSQPTVYDWHHLLRLSIRAAVWVIGPGMWLPHAIF